MSGVCVCLHILSEDMVVEACSGTCAAVQEEGGLWRGK